MTTTASLEMNFCRRCGTPLAHTTRHVYRCTNGHTMYANSSPASGVFLLAPNDRILLAVRGNEPNKGMLCALGGFVDSNESFEAAAVRELNEEASLQPGDYEPLQYITSAHCYYLYQSELVPALTALFWTRLTTERQLTLSDEVTAIKSVPLHTVDLALMHNDDIREGIRQLRTIFPNKHTNKEA